MEIFNDYIELQTKSTDSMEQLLFNYKATDRSVVKI